MAEDRVETREAAWRQLFPWTELFKGFQIALDLNKMLLAAAGILTMSIGWWLLSLMFYAGSGSIPTVTGEDGGKDYQEVRKSRQLWNLWHEAINLGTATTDGQPHRYEVEDIAETDQEFKLVREIAKDLPVGVPLSKAILERVAELDKARGGKLTKDEQAFNARLRSRATQYDLVGRVKPSGRLSAMPWSEDRGPNPYLLATNQTAIPWEPGHFWEWFSRDQVPVMVEPLVKFVRPIIYFLRPGNDFASRTYFLLTTLVMLLTWAVFGGAITRIAAVQYARGERIGMFEALRFALKRLLDYILAPVFPLAFVFVLMVFMWIFGIFHLIPVVGDILVSGLFWVIPLTFGLIMAVALVGLVGWPLMAATISTEGTDSWEAVSRSYSYVYQRPWNYIWYTLVSVAYGAVVVFFVGFMASFAVYLAKWGVNNAGYFGRQPNFLFIYAPTSFGWRELLLEGTQAPSGGDVVQGRSERPASEGAVGGVSRWNRINEANYKEYVGSLNWWNKAGAVLVSFWLGLAFLLVLGFGYSFFWTAATIMYFLLRKSVDTNELDEVYQEEDDFEAPYTPPAQPPAPAAPPNPLVLPMVAPPPAPAPAPSPVVAAPPPPAPTPPPAPEPAPAPPPAQVEPPKPTPPADPEMPPPMPPS